MTASPARPPLGSHDHIIHRLASPAPAARTTTFTDSPRGARRRASAAAARLALPHDTAAIDHERLARDVSRLVGGEEHRGRADVLRLLLTLHRHDVGDALLEHLARGHALERRVGLR